jgi:hypothetical protein
LVAAQSRLRHWEECPESVIDTCEDISARIDQVPRRIVEQLRSQVDALLDGQQRQLLRLGSFVDELTRRRTVGRELLLNAIQQTMVRDQARCQRLNWSRLSEQGQSELRDNEVIWPTEPYDFSVCAPDQGWGRAARFASDPSRPHAVATLGGLSEARLWFTEILLWAGAGPTAPELAAGGVLTTLTAVRPILLVDISDSGIAWLRRMTDRRRADYERNSWLAPGEHPALRAIERFLASRPEVVH